MMNGILMTERFASESFVHEAAGRHILPLKRQRVHKPSHSSSLPSVLATR